MLRFKNRNAVPPKGFQYVDSDTGTTISHRIYEQWLADIAKHREGNNLPQIDPAVAEDQNCKRLGNSAADAYCISDEPVSAANGVTLGFWDVVRGTAALAEFKLKGSPLVPQEEAERRAEICAHCWNNTQIRLPCGGKCGDLQDIVTSIVGASGTTKDDKLQACAVCRCTLKAKVWLPMDILKRTETEEMKKQWSEECWMRENSSPA